MRLGARPFEYFGRAVSEGERVPVWWIPHGIATCYVLPVLHVSPALSALVGLPPDLFPNQTLTLSDLCAPPHGEETLSLALSARRPCTLLLSLVDWSLATVGRAAAGSDAAGNGAA
ncbi:hypothetical protein H632_c2534p0, partial [Helicosporidium sp. ATCC 50920]